MNNLKSIAGENLTCLSMNSYPGRIIVAGMDDSGYTMVLAYALMGRSDNSRNRVMVKNGKGSVHTMAADPAKVEDASLIIYRAMAEQGACHVVTNGVQTESILQAAHLGETFQHGLRDHQYEPDAPNFTPRISAVCKIFNGGVARPQGPPVLVGMSILRKSDFGQGCDRIFYRYDEFAPGFGHCLSTYSGAGDPLPPFRGEPYLLPLVGGSAEEIALHLWGALNEENRISIAVKLIPIMGGETRIHIINKYQAVQ